MDVKRNVDLPLLGSTKMVRVISLNRFQGRIHVKEMFEKVIRFFYLLDYIRMKNVLRKQVSLILRPAIYGRHFDLGHLPTIKNRCFPLF